jgi:SAM-dependent methyltransferase
VAEETVPKSIWDSDETAASYAAFTGEFTMYQDTSRDLVELAGPAPGAAVVDLACGTGVTTREILAVLGQDGRVTGVDRSAAMLAVAGRSVTDPRVSWVRASAEEFDQAVPGPVEAVICNSAIWQTDFASTARAARAVLAPGGVLAFNIGAEFVRDAARIAGPAQFPLMTMMRQIAADQHGGHRPTGRSPGRHGSASRRSASSSTRPGSPSGMRDGCTMSRPRNHSSPGCGYPRSPTGTWPDWAMRPGWPCSMKRSSAWARPEPR